MTENLDEVLRRTTIFRRLSGEDRQRLATVAIMRTYDKGQSAPCPEGGAGRRVQ